MPPESDADGTRGASTASAKSGQLTGDPFSQGQEARSEAPSNRCKHGVAERHEGAGPKREKRPGPKQSQTRDGKQDNIQRGRVAYDASIFAAAFGSQWHFEIALLTSAI